MSESPSKLRFLPPLVALVLLEILIYVLSGGIWFPMVSWAGIAIFFWWLVIPAGYALYKYSRSRESK